MAGSPPAVGVDKVPEVSLLKVEPDKVVSSLIEIPEMSLLTAEPDKVPEVSFLSVEPDIAAVSLVREVDKVPEVSLYLRLSLTKFLTSRYFELSLV